MSRRRGFPRLTAEELRELEGQQLPDPLGQEFFSFDLDPTKPLVLLLGRVAHEGVVSALSAAGRQYKEKHLESGIRNWRSILRYFERFTVREVLWKLTGEAYELLLNPDYRSARDELLGRISSVPHVLFVHQGLLSGRDETGLSLHHQPTEGVCSQVNDLFAKHELNILPFTRNAEVTVLASEFIGDTEQGLLLRVYVPSGRMWSQETDRLLQLFRDYLAKIGKFSVRLDQTRTDKGVIYEFHGEEGSRAGDLSSEFDEFSQFLDLCVSRPESAQELLSARAIPDREVAEIVTRYAKEASRLQVDIKQERERKLLGIRHRLESELVDLGTGSLQNLEALIDSAVPRIEGIGSAVAVDQSPLQLPLASGPANLTLNLNPQIVQAVNGVVAREIRGDVHLTSEDKELLGLAHAYGGKNSATLASAVHELADESAPKSGRLAAKQRLKKFLIEVASRAGDVATGVLQSYIESKLGV